MTNLRVANEDKSGEECYQDKAPDHTEDDITMEGESLKYFIRGALTMIKIYKKKKPAMSRTKLAVMQCFLMKL